MKQKLQPGSELDLLTESELRKTLDEVMRGLTIEPANVRALANDKTTAAGALTLTAFDVPMGMGFTLSRLLVRADGFTAAVPFTGAGGMLEVLRNDVLVDFKSLVSGAVQPAGLPALLVYGSDSAAWFSNGDVVVVRITAGPASAGVTVLVEGDLTPVVLGN